MRSVAHRKTVIWLPEYQIWLKNNPRALFSSFGGRVGLCVIYLVDTKCKTSLNIDIWKVKWQLSVTQLKYKGLGKKSGKQWPHLEQESEPGFHTITEALGWKLPPRSSCPTFDWTPPCKLNPKHCVPHCHFFINSRDSDSTTCLGSTFQCLTTLWVKKLLRMSNLNLPRCNLRVCPLLLLVAESSKIPLDLLLSPG